MSFDERLRWVAVFSISAADWKLLVTAGVLDGHAYCLVRFSGWFRSMGPMIFYGWSIFEPVNVQYPCCAKLAVGNCIKFSSEVPTCTLPTH